MSSRKSQVGLLADETGGAKIEDKMLAYQTRLPASLLSNK